MLSVLAAVISSRNVLRLLTKVSVQVNWGMCGLMTVAHRHLVSSIGTYGWFRHATEQSDWLLLQRGKAARR